MSIYNFLNVRPILYVESHVFTIQLIESTNYMMMYVIHFF